MKLKDILGSKNPFPKSKCIKKTCPLCTESQYVDVDTEEVKIECNTNNVGYRWRCLTCKERDIVSVYEGETGRSARTRGAEYQNISSQSGGGEKSQIFLRCCKT